MKQVNNNWRHKSCPLCGSSEIAARGTIPYPAETLFSSLQVLLEHVPELWCCRACGSGFAQNVITEETAREIYESSDICDRWTTTVPFEKNMTRKVSGILRTIFSQARRVADLGCNTGDLLDFARSFGCITYGVEASSLAGEVCRKRGHIVMEHLADLEDSVDVITAFSLIEHLHDFPAFLEGCRKALSPTGRLVILTGDIWCLSARLTGPNWWYLRYPEHILFPSRRYFESFSRFKIEKWTHTYASVFYQSYPAIVFIRGLWALVTGTYQGLPSLGPDHFLGVLRK